MTKQSINRASCLGFSLLELLVALSIVSVGLVGFAQLQQKTLAVEREQIHRLQAHLLLDEITTTLQTTAVPERYLSAQPDNTIVTDCIATACDADTFIQFQLTLWNCRSSNTLSNCSPLAITPPPFPRGQLAIQSATNRLTAQLKWQAINGQEHVLTRHLPRLPPN